MPLCWPISAVLVSSVVQWSSRAQLFVTPWSAVLQAPLSFTISRSLLKLMSIESVMPSNHLILCGSFLQSFLMSWLFASGGKVLELQLQHQSFQ